MKKLSCLFLVLLMMAATLAGCAPGTGAEPAAESADTAAATVAPTQEAVTEVAQDAGIKKGGTLKIGVNSEIVHTMLSFTLTGTGVDYYSSGRYMNPCSGRTRRAPWIRGCSRATRPIPPV